MHQQTSTFPAALHLKTGGTQFSLRTYPADAGPLRAMLPELNKSINESEEWSLGKKSVELKFNGTPMANSSTTLSYYPAAGYIEFNVNKGNALHNYVETRYAPQGPVITFDATFSPAITPDGVATIDLRLRKS